MSRTRLETADEISALRELLNGVPQTSVFGDDNHDSIYAQIRVLERSMDRAALLSEFEDEPAYTLSAALDALEWLHDGGEPPSDGWALLAERTLAAA